MEPWNVWKVQNDLTELPVCWLLMLLLVAGFLLWAAVWELSWGWTDRAFHSVQGDFVMHL